MQIKSKKLISVLLCAGALATGSLVTVNVVNQQTTMVQASSSHVSARKMGVDVAVYQSSSLNSPAKAGAQFAVVKVSEGTSYRNPKAASQIASAKKNDMMPMAYHFATFGANKSQAKKEGKYAVSSAKAFGLPAGSYIACDWETGDGNNVNGGSAASANAILSFMNQVKASGYQPLLYSGAYLLNSTISTSKILAQYPNSLWVASYATTGRIDSPNFNYFPSMNGVIIWQFTDNWRGLNVDGNISLLPLSYNKPVTQAPKASDVDKNNTTENSAATDKNTKMVMHRAAIYDENGNKTGKPSFAAYKRVEILGGIVNIKGQDYYKVGNNEYILIANVDGQKVKVTHNAWVYKSNGRRVNTYTRRKGSIITVYGGEFHFRGRAYYRVGAHNQYVKAANLDTSTLK